MLGDEFAPKITVHKIIRFYQLELEQRSSLFKAPTQTTEPLHPEIGYYQEFAYLSSIAFFSKPRVLRDTNNSWNK